MKIVKNNQLKIVIFTAVKNRCILHGHVFVMFVRNKRLRLSSKVREYTTSTVDTCKKIVYSLCYVPLLHDMNMNFSFSRKCLKTHSLKFL